jgi:hypothetical protein
MYRRNVYNFVKRHSELIVIFLKELEINREYVTGIIQSLSVYDFISDERKITTDIIRVRVYVAMFICKDLQTYKIYHFDYSSGMSLEAGNRRKSPVTLAVTAGYFFSLKKMRENLSSISNTMYSACIY